MSDLYRIFDTTVACDFPLPELPQSAGQKAEISVTLGVGDADQVDLKDFETAYEWRDNEDTLICWCERLGNDYLFVFPRNASFHVASEGLITCYLHAGSTMQLLRHLLLNQIIPRYLATSGRLVIHAGAVKLENGKTVAFLGNSGFGKSTLVSSFHRNGAKLINDDCILLERSEKGVIAIGGLAGIRLFPDSVDAVFSESTGFANYTWYTDKQQLFLKNEVDGKHPSHSDLDVVYLLNDPWEQPVETIAIEAVSVGDAMLALIYSSFSLDPSDRKTITNNFHNVGQAISERLPIYRLKYPRVHERLPDVRSAVLAHVESTAKSN